MKVLALPIAALAVAGCVAVNSHADVASSRQPSPQEIVAARQSAFHLTGAAMGNIKGTIDRGGDPSGQAYSARGIARWARALPGMFPENTASVSGTRARPEIFANRADFNSKAAAFSAAADQLAAAAQSNDKQAFTAAWQATGATCASCHQSYQVPQQR